MLTAVESQSKKKGMGGSAEAPGNIEDHEGEGLQV